MPSSQLPKHFMLSNTQFEDLLREIESTYHIPLFHWSTVKYVIGGNGYPNNIWAISFTRVRGGLFRIRWSFYNDWNLEILKCINRIKGGSNANQKK